MVRILHSTAQPLRAYTGLANPQEDSADKWLGAALSKYRIIRRIARGGMGVVYEAVDPVLQRRVAVKLLPEALTRDAIAQHKFLSEARAAARLNHPNVVPVHDAGEHRGVPYLVMELLEGGSANDRLKTWGPFPWAEATRVIADVCRGLAAAHAVGLIHRDIKPSNIMRGRDGTVKLADFGLAAAVSAVTGSLSPQSGNIVGTPMYMSPEQCRGSRLNARSDLYSLGATYFALLTNSPPYNGRGAMDMMYGHCSKPVPDPRELQPDVPVGCAELIALMMAKKPEDRPATAETLLAELDRLAARATNPDATPHDWRPDPPMAELCEVTRIESRSRIKHPWLYRTLFVLTLIIGLFPLIWKWTASLRFQHQGPYLAWVTDSTLHIVPVNDSDVMKEIVLELPGQGEVLVASGSSKILVARGREIYVIDAATRKPDESNFKIEGKVTAVAVHPSGDRVALGMETADGQQIIIAKTNGDESRQIPIGDKASPDITALAFAGEDLVIGFSSPTRPLNSMQYYSDSSLCAPKMHQTESRYYLYPAASLLSMWTPLHA